MWRFFSIILELIPILHVSEAALKGLAAYNDPGFKQAYNVHLHIKIVLFIINF
jgi:hypothetical protein